MKFRKKPTFVTAPSRGLGFWTGLKGTSEPSPSIPHHLFLLSECGCPWSSCALLLLLSLSHRGGLHAQTVSYSELFFCKCLYCYSVTAVSTALKTDIVPEDSVSEYDVTVNSLHKRRQKTYPQMYMHRKHIDSPMVVVMV